MGPMTFYNAMTQTAAEDAALQEDYNAAELFWKVRLGAQNIYFPRRLKTVYLPLSALTRAFIRVEVTISRVCCGPAEFNRHFLILCGGDEELASIELDSQVKAERILAALGERGIPTGKPAAEA